MSTSSDPKIIVIVGGTGAQGRPIIKLLLEPSSDGKPSPYKVRAITRDPTSVRAKEIEALGAELYKGSFMDFDVISRAMKGAYGAFINTDSFTIGEMEEIYAGIKIYEAAKVAGLRHFIYSSFFHPRRMAGWKDIYECSFFETKAHVGDYIKAQPNEIDNPSGTMWSLICTGPYYEMLGQMSAPVKQRADGTFVFVSPLGDGHIPFIAREDIAVWARHIFDHPDATTTGVEIGIASAMTSFDQIAEAFTKVTGQKAEVVRVTLDEFFDLFEQEDLPVALDAPAGSRWKQAFTGFWASYRDDINVRDMNKMLEVNPNTVSLEKWMRDNNYVGKRRFTLKNDEDAQRQKIPPWNQEKILAL